MSGGIPQSVGTARTSITAAQGAGASGADKNAAITAAATALDDAEAEITRLTALVTPLDFTDATAVQTFITQERNKRPTLSEAEKAIKAAEELSKKVHIAYHAGQVGNLQLRDPTVSEELDYYRQGTTPDPHRASADLKMLHLITPFKGLPSEDWRIFETPWLQAIKNRAVSEQDLKTAFTTRLQGAALIFYQTLPRVNSLSFGQILEAMRERYSIDPIKARTRMRAITQGPKETVEEYADRMSLVGKSLNPREPRELQILKAGNVEITIPNPLYKEQLKEWENKVFQNESTMTQHFLQGLRVEIQARLNSGIYHDYRALIREAEAAQWMQEETPKLGVNYALALESLTEQVNALHLVKKGKNRGENRRTQASASPGAMGGGIICFKCGVQGHMARDCQAKGPEIRKKPSVFTGRNRGKSTGLEHRGITRPFIRKRAVLHRRQQRFKKGKIHALTGEVEQLQYNNEEAEMLELEDSLTNEEFDAYWCMVEEEAEELDNSKNE